MNQEQKQELIDHVMDCFDFETVKKTMNFLKWKWSMIDSDERVPDILEIKQSARDRLKNALSNESGFSSTGGFEAKFEDGVLSLKFVVSDWDAQIGDL